MGERLPPDLDSVRAGPDVADAVRGGSPPRTDHRLMGQGVMAQHHRGHGVRLAGLGRGVEQHQKCAAEQPAPASAVQGERDPEDGERQTTWTLTQSQQGPAADVLNPMPRRYSFRPPSIRVPRLWSSAAYRPGWASQPADRAIYLLGARISNPRRATTGDPHAPEVRRHHCRGEQGDGTLGPCGIDSENQPDEQ